MDLLNEEKDDVNIVEGKIFIEDDLFSELKIVFDIEVVFDKLG